jgi:integrase
MILTERAPLERLLPAVPARFRALVAVAAGTGLRWGEVAGLRWDAIDVAAGTVSVVRVAEEVSGHVRLKRYPKSRAGRTVPMTAFVVELLRTHGRDFPAGVEGLVFVARTGEPLKRTPHCASSPRRSPSSSARIPQVAASYE